MFLVEQTLFVTSIPEYLFEQLKEFADEGLKLAEKTGDDSEVSTREEYNMETPREFEEWIAQIIDLYFHKHKGQNGFYGLDDKHLKISSIWVNRMLKGDQHNPHTHKNCMYAFVAYIKTSENDAGFCYFHPTVDGRIAVRSLPITQFSQAHVMIFPADMPHTVYQKVTDDERISVSGNICCYVDGGYVD